MRALDALSRDVLRWQQTHDNATGERIAKALAPYVNGKASKMPRIHMGAIANPDPDDLKQFLWKKVFEAAELFDPSRGAKFSTYAMEKLKHAVKEYWREDGGRLIKNGRARPDLWRGVTTLNRPAHSARNEKDEVELLELIPSREAPLSETVLSDVTCEELTRLMNRFLPKRELAVMQMRLQGLNLPEIGQLMSISDTRAYQLEKQAQRRMRVKAQAYL